MATPPSPMSYRDAGVDIDAGEALVARIAPLAAATKRLGTDAALGGFGGLFDLKAAGFTDPVLVAGTDGVGTKLLIAIASGRHEGIGVDLVAMCVNDVLAQGAEPLFFLDYFATGKLDVGVAETVVAGVAEGCRLAGCALIGGETAEMPGMYPPGHYDLAGFTVGAVERTMVLPRTSDMTAGDVLLGLPSSGPHSNGYSMIRAIVARSGLAWDAPSPFAEGTLAQSLLTPTRIYVRALLPVIRSGRIKGLAHITGGGLVENPPRMCPPTLQPRLTETSAPMPDVFRWLKSAGGVDDAEMRRTFNCGTGMLIAVAPGDVDAVLGDLRAAGEHPFIAGDLAPA
ncbi:phosphoribosylformylglycinamidine cyclo-ligase [bacterium]|nr:phosphoribosylformylglycinamidine cyclo-ligase [bacterium]